MIDRIKQTNALKKILNENFSYKTIVIKAEPGAGATYFIKYHCEKDGILFVENRFNTFVSALMRALISYKENSFIDHIKQFHGSNLIDSISLGTDSYLLEKTLTDWYNQEYKLEYEKTRDDVSSFTIDFKSIVIDFLNKISCKYIAFEKFDDSTECEQIIEFIAVMRNNNIFLNNKDEKTQKNSEIKTKDFIVITSYTDRYNRDLIGVINIEPFDSSEDYKELIKTKLPLNSEQMTNELSIVLFHNFKGSPKKLDNFLKVCEEDLNLCKTDRELYETIIYKSREYVEQIDALAEDILLALYFSKVALQNRILQEIIFLFNSVPASVYAEKVEILRARELLIKQGIYLRITDKGIAHISAKQLAKAENKSDVCRAWIASLKELIKHRPNVLNEEQATAILSNIFLELPIKSDKDISDNCEIVKKHADRLKAMGSENIAAKYYAAIIRYLTKFINHYSEAMNIAHILYANGYYVECEAFLKDLQSTVKNNNVDEQFDYYMLRGNCNMLADNATAEDYYRQAESLNTDKKLIATGCKLMAMVESNNENKRDAAKKEYSEIIKSVDISKYGYLSLCRNALDFQNNQAAIQTLEKWENCNDLNEVYKIKQNLALNYIKCGKIDEAKILLNDTLQYCETQIPKEISYPLINLAVICLYQHFNCDKEVDKIKLLLQARTYIIKAIDHASSYYAMRLSRLHNITILSYIYNLQNNPYNISHSRLVGLRQTMRESIKRDNRNDFRAVARSYLALIASARITNDLEEARKDFCEGFSSIAEQSGQQPKYNELLTALDIKGREPLVFQQFEAECDEYYKEIRFEPWLISLTHY